MALLSLEVTSHIIKAMCTWLGFVGGSSLARGIITADAADNLQTPTPESVAAKSVVDSQIRYSGAFIAGVGALGWWASNDIPARRGSLCIIGVAIVACGLGRVLSGWQYGFGAPWLKRALWVEIIVPVVFWVVGTWE